MGRLNQTRRAGIGYVYSAQRQNDISLQPTFRSLSYAQKQSFDQNMTGSGIKENVDKFMNVVSSDAMQQASRVVFDNMPSRVQNRIRDVGKRVEPLRNALSRREEIIKLIKEKRGNGLSLAGGMQHGMGIQHSRGSVPTSAGMGLRLSGQGLSLAGGAYDAPSLPGAELKKKLLRKMIREKKMKALGDRKKTSPIAQGMIGSGLSLAGGNLTISGTSSGMSRNKTYDDMKMGYKINPKPLIGQGMNQINPSIMIKYLQNKAIPLLKANKLLPTNIKNTDKIKKLIAMRANKYIKEGLKDPQKIIMNLLKSLKPIMKGRGLSLAGSGVSTILAKLGWKLFSGLLKLSGSPLAKPAESIANYKGSGKKYKKSKKMSGGFIFSVPAIIAAISAAVSTAMGTTIIGSITVGGVITAAISAAASAAADKLIKELMKDKDKKGSGLFDKQKERIKERIKKELKNKLMKVLKKIRITKDDFNNEEIQKLMKGYNKFKEDKKMGRIKRFAEYMAPTIKEVARRKTEAQAKKFINSYMKKLGLKGNGLKLSGQGLKLSGQGLKLSGQGKNSFSKSFIKNFINEMQKLEKKRQ
jgi:hypothetical protein